MSQWKYRRIASPQQEFAIAPATLASLLKQGSLGQDYEFLPPTGGNWIRAAEALQQLNSTPPISPPTPTAVPPAASPPRVIVGRPPSPAPVVPAPAATPAPPRERWKSEAAPGTPTPAAAAPAPVATVAPPPRAAPPPVPSAALPAVPATSHAAPTSPGGDENSRPRLRSWTSDEEEELDLTPMIDVTFLLLIFFMVASTVTQFANLQLPKSTTGDTEDPRDRVVLLLDFPEMLHDSELGSFTGGRPLLIGEAKFRLAGSPDDIPVEALADRLKEEFQSQNKTQLILQAHRKIPASLVRKVLMIARESGARQTLVGVSVAQ